MRHLNSEERAHSQHIPRSREVVRALKRRRKVSKGRYKDSERGCTRYLFSKDIQHPASEGGYTGKSLRRIGGPVSEKPPLHTGYYSKVIGEANTTDQLFAWCNG